MMSLIPILVSLPLLAAPQAEVRMLSGSTLRGELHSVSPQAVVLHTSEGEQSLDVKQLLAVSLAAGAASAAQPKVWVDLVDGTRLTGLEYTAAGDEATLKLVDGEELKIPTRLVSVVRLKEQDERIARQWADILAIEHASDVLVVRREEAIDFVEGVLGPVTEESVAFTLDGDQVNVKRPRVEGLLYHRAKGPPLPEAACEVVALGSLRIPAAKLQSDAGKLAIFTPGGLELSLPLEKIKELDFSAGKLRYLSDLEWESLEQREYLAGPNAPSDRFFQPRRDASFVGPLRLGNETYAKGLALKSYTKLVYRLPGKFSRLAGLAGIHPSLKPHGNVRLVIRGDDRPEPLLDCNIAGGDEPLQLSLDLTGVRRLTIEVDYGEGGDSGDHLNLCDVRIIQ